VDHKVKPAKSFVERRGTTETSDGMVIDWDVPVTMDDGLVLRADVYRPVAEGRYPIILSYGPYPSISGRWRACSRHT
jgi:predicted acyl esterase